MKSVLRYGSVCSGIEAATVAWHPLGWTPAFFSEIEPFPRAVLEHHYPEVPTHGDFTTIEPGQYGPIDLLVGGTPCQDFSEAGLRAGLDGDRGRLTLEFVRLLDRYSAARFVWENVPNVLSIDEGRAFGTFLGLLEQLGYGFAYRVFDAQYFGTPQRRERVFVVGYRGEWRKPAAILFEAEDLYRHDPPSSSAGSCVTAYSPSGFGGYAEGVGTLRASGGSQQREPILIEDGLARYATPVEWERLMGFPDDYTLVPFRGRPAAVTPRKYAIGNSMHVGTMRWIGERIALVESLVAA